MLDPTIDTMALAMASFTLDQVEQDLRDQGKSDLADALQKLQIDTGHHMAAISAGFETPEDFIEQKTRADGSQEEPLSDDTIAQIKNFEPLTYERLKILKIIQSHVSDKTLQSELEELNIELAPNAPELPALATSLKPNNPLS